MFFFNFGVGKMKFHHCCLPSKNHFDAYARFTWCIIRIKFVWSGIKLATFSELETLELWAERCYGEQAFSKLKGQGFKKKVVPRLTALWRHHRGKTGDGIDQWFSTRGRKPQRGRGPSLEGSWEQIFYVHSYITFALIEF